MRLRYNGSGEWIPGVPARDLDDDGIEAVSRWWQLPADEVVAMLVRHGLYSEVDSAPDTFYTEGYISEVENVTAARPLHDNPEDYLIDAQDGAEVEKGKTS